MIRMGERDEPKVIRSIFSMKLMVVYALIKSNVIENTEAYKEVTYRLPTPK